MYNNNRTTRYFPDDLRSEKAQLLAQIIAYIEFNRILQALSYLFRRSVTHDKEQSGNVDFCKVRKNDFASV